MKLRVQQVVILGLDIPSVTFSEFFDEAHILRHVALILNVDISNVSHSILTLQNI